MTDILIVLGSASDRSLTDKGLGLLEEMVSSYQLRIASAHRASSYLHDIVDKFNKEAGKVIICVAGKSAHLGGVVASMTSKPVLCVPVYNPETSGMDALLSMSQMPQGIPTATMGFGVAGFSNACLFAMQILALNKSELGEKMLNYRTALKEKVIHDDQKYQRKFQI